MKYNINWRLWIGWADIITCMGHPAHQRQAMRLMRDLNGQQTQGGTSVTGSMNAPEAGSRDPQAAAREVRADQYFERDLQDQRRWYSKHAGQFKSRAQVLGIA